MPVDTSKKYHWDNKNFQERQPPSVDPHIHYYGETGMETTVNIGRDI
jgi:hypothetical protein